MDRHTEHSNSFDFDSATRASFGSLTAQPSGNWRLASTPGAGVSYGLGFVWPALCAGQLRLVRHAQDQTQTTLYLEERRAEDAWRWAIRGRCLDVLQRVLAGQSLNFISLELALSGSTISAEFKVAMQTLGLPGRLSGLPLFLPQLWHATRAPAPASMSVRSTWDGVGCTTVTLPRPDLTLASLLSPAELEVSRMLLQGSTHAEIASARGTSLRTTANQIASVFAKLKVSGRLELITTLAQGRVRWNPTLSGPGPVAERLLD